MNSQTSIPCPVCGTPIPIFTSQLIAGASFPCPGKGCDAALSLSSSSSSSARSAMGAFEDLKNSAPDD